MTGSHPLRTRHGLCTYVQTGSILVCTPKTIMSQPPLDSPKASGEASKADQPLSCLWMSTFQAAEGTQPLDLSAAQLQPLTPELPHQLATSTCSWSREHSTVSPLAPEVGPYSAAPPHPSPLAAKGRGSVPGTNSTQRILGMPLCPSERAACLFSIYIKIVCILL